MRKTPDNSAPTVLVLGGGSTSLAVIRSLARESVKAVVVGFTRNDECRFSRCCQYVSRFDQRGFDARLAEWLVSTFGGASNQFVLMPVCDRSALFVAKFEAIFQQHFLRWRNSYAGLKSIVSKDELYASATREGIAVPQYVASPSPDELVEWVHRHDAPYIVKPFFVADPNSPLTQKNVILNDREAAADFANQVPLDALIVQQKLQGGDGRMYDCYGLCDKRGEVVSVANHLRIRQTRKGAGVTCYGEIPVKDAPFPIDDICENTRRLFSAIRFHGIFGVEWLWDIKTESLYLIDINARPFSSIGHLCDSGLNLPVLAVEELSGSITLRRPTTLTHTYWIDFSADSRRAYKEIKSGRLTLGRWLRDIIRARSYARWKFSDPIPAVISLARLAHDLADLAIRRVKSASKKGNPAGSAG